MVVYSFYIFDRHGKDLCPLSSFRLSFPSLHYVIPLPLLVEKPAGPNLTIAISLFPAECIYKRRWPPRPSSTGGGSSRPTFDINPLSNGVSTGTGRSALSAEDDAKLIFGTVFSLRNMVRKLGGDDDRYVRSLIAHSGSMSFSTSMCDTVLQLSACGLASFPIELASTSSITTRRLPISSSSCSRIPRPAACV